MTRFSIKRFCFKDENGWALRLALPLIMAMCSPLSAAPFAFAKAKDTEITADSKSGFTLGWSSGVRVIDTNAQSNTLDGDFGFSLGYILYFSNSYGIRLSGNYMFDMGTYIPTNGESGYGSHEFLFNFDFLYDFYNNNEKGMSMGIFAGLGSGYLIQNPRHFYSTGGTSNNGTLNRSGFEAFFNAGFSSTFNSKHRIEVTYRYAILTPEFRYTYTNAAGGGGVAGPTNGPSTTPASVPFVFNVGYSYVF